MTLEPPKLFRSLMAPVVLGWLAAAFAGAAAAQALSEHDLIAALQKGGLVVVMRHAHSPAQSPAPGQADAANPNRERQLDSAGRASAQAMGDALKALQIPVGEVWSSPTYRARQTVLLLGVQRPTLAPQLGDQGHSMQAVSARAGAWLRGKAAEPPEAGKDNIIVTQAPNISAAFGQQAAGLGDGGALIFRPAPGAALVLLGRIPMEDWPRNAPSGQER